MFEPSAKLPASATASPDTRVKIALFTTSFPSRTDSAVNAGACVATFAEILTDLGHEVHVVTPYKRGARHDFRHQGTTFFRWLGREDSLSHINLRHPIGAAQLASVVLMGCFAARRLRRRFEPDHVLCFWVLPSGVWARLARADSGVAYSLWALGSDIWVLGKLPALGPVFTWLARDAAHLYADGPTLARDFSTLAGAEVRFLATSRVLEVPAGVPAGEGGYYLFLGRYHPNKGIDLLIDAVSRARHELPDDFRLRAHGFGPLDAELRERVVRLGLNDRVRIEGPAVGNEVARVLRRARGLIIPSRIESLPLVLSDGLRMELPLLVTDVGDMGTLVRRFEAGLVCKPDVESLAAALVRFVAAPPAGGNTALSMHLDIRNSARQFLADISAPSRGE
jgi:glycosyltransferase involved in cell wall biosynthesis